MKYTHMSMNEELDSDQINRQDFVDNCITKCVNDLLVDLNYYIEYDSEIIGKIRDTIFYSLVDKGILSDKDLINFYPYIEEDI